MRYRRLLKVQIHCLSTLRTIRIGPIRIIALESYRIEEELMTETFVKLESYFDWLVIACGFVALLLSFVSLLLVIVARNRIARAETMITQAVDAINKVIKDSERMS